MVKRLSINTWLGIVDGKKENSPIMVGNR